MPSEPAHTLLLRVLIYLGSALLGFVALGLIGAAVDTPARAVVDGVAGQFGSAGVLALLIGGFAGLATFTRWAVRRGDRQQVAETGILEHRRPAIVRERLGRNVAILLAPLAVLAAIGLAMWLTGTPLPPGALR